MAQTSKRIEVRTGEGTLLFSLRLIETEIEPEAKPQHMNPARPEPRPERSPPANGQSGDPLMTDAQKRYLFRLLADQGIEKDRAYQFLKETFGVQVLKEVTKSDASRMISQLVGEGDGGGGDGSSL
jgi:hypothetical protein